MKVEYGRDADILYIKLKDSKIVDTRMLDEDVYVDIDTDENFVGIEIWKLLKMLYCRFPEKSLKKSK